MEQIVLILQVAVLVCLSALCSGLNIGLMSLKVADLKRKSKLGDSHARRVLPLRKKAHLTLSAILFTNVAAVSATSLVLGDHLNGVLAGLISTLLIVIFGELLPQAWFNRFALKFCSTLVPMMRIMIILTYPVSKPLQLLLDKMLGHEASNLHSRHELGIIMGEHLSHRGSELDEDEIEIIRSTLLLSEKRVRDIMTPISHVYWLTPDTLIDGRKVNELKSVSWSRIPIFNTKLTHVYGVLLMKDLVDVDFDEEPIHIDDLPIHHTTEVGSMTALDTLFRKFIGAKSHMMPVERDDKIVGIVTIEDLIEEILGHEIEDESDASRLRGKQSR